MTFAGIVKTVYSYFYHKLATKICDKVEIIEKKVRFIFLITCDTKILKDFMNSSNFLDSTPSESRET